MEIKRDKFSHARIKISCPIKGLGCRALKPRWVDAYSIKTQTGGRCITCSKIVKAILKLKKKFGPNLKFKFGVLPQGRRRLQVFVSCPLKFQECDALNPRWIWSELNGVCRHCSKFKGGWLDRWGYKRFRINDKTVAEHRWIMEKILGRKLRKGETVHHKNGKRADNRETNLELRMSGRHPKGWSLRQMREYLKTVPKRLGGLK